MIHALDCGRLVDAAGGRCAELMNPATVQGPGYEHRLGDDDAEATVELTSVTW